jgi:hypothetical protein
VVSEVGHGTTFTFTVPVYSLAKLLSPVIAYQGKLRTSFVLVEVDLKPLSAHPRGDWRGMQRHALDTLRRCVYLDKDLVLPPMGSAAPEETFFIVASTNMEHSGVMTTRIREQLERIPEFAARASLMITTVPIESPAATSSATLEEQVQEVAGNVTALVMKKIGEEPMSLKAHSGLATHAR